MNKNNGEKVLKNISFLFDSKSKNILKFNKSKKIEKLNIITSF